MIKTVDVKSRLNVAIPWSNISPEGSTFNLTLNYVIFCFVPFRLCGEPPFSASDAEVLSGVIRDSDMESLVRKSKLLENVSSEGNLVQVVFMRVENITLLSV